MPYVVIRLAARDSARRFCPDDLACFFAYDDFDNSTYDGNKNVAELIVEDGEIAANGTSPESIRGSHGKG